MVTLIAIALLFDSPKIESRIDDYVKHREAYIVVTKDVDIIAKVIRPIVMCTETKVIRERNYIKLKWGSSVDEEWIKVHLTCIAKIEKVKFINPYSAYKLR